ncbi:hypothetical protein HK096_007997, partial [Nowakowskiella sp. JEL0078]
MERDVQYYEKQEYIETVRCVDLDTSNKVSQYRFFNPGSQKTIIQTDCIVRADLKRAGGSQVVIAIGRYCSFGQRAVIRPPYKTYKGIFSYYPTKIGDYVHIGDDSVVEAAQIGTHVIIGKNCVIGRFAIIKECCRILDNTVIPPNTVVPSFSVYGGNP